MEKVIALGHVAEYRGLFTDVAAADRWWSGATGDSIDRGASMIRDPYERNGQTTDPLLLARVTAPLWATVLVGAGWVTGRWLAVPTRTIGPWVGVLCGGAIAAIALFALAVESRMEHTAAELLEVERRLAGPEDR